MAKSKDAIEEHHTALRRLSPVRCAGGTVDRTVVPEANLSIEAKAPALHVGISDGPALFRLTYLAPDGATEAKNRALANRHLK